MKRFKIFGLIATLVFTISSCETEVEDPAGLRGVGVVPAISDLNPAVFDSNDLENTFVQFTVNVDDPKVNEVIVVASFNGDKSRTEITKVSSYPATVKLLLSEVASKLGMQLSSIKAADVIDIELITVQNGTSYFSNAAIIAAVVCGYEPDRVSGSFHAVSDSWGLDGNVTITVDPNDEYIVYVSGLAAIEGLVEDQGPLKMIINELDFSVTAEKTVLASDVIPWDLPYTNYFYEGFGKLNTCDGSYEMTFTIGVDQGTFGAFDFVFTKN